MVIQGPLYQGPVPQGYDLQKFRKTGITEKIEKKDKPKKKRKLKIKISKNKVLRKPTAKVQRIDPKKFITTGMGRPSLVREGKTGYIDEEMMEEMRWLG